MGINERGIIMKAILISIKPKWCALMMNGKKKIEVRKGTALYKAIKKLIDEYGYADIYVYCTKGKDLLYKCINGGYDYDNWKVLENRDSDNYILNGKVIFKFRCYKVEEIRPNIDLSIMDSHSKELIRCANLSLFEGCEYLKWNTGYAIHISDLEIFDKPKNLSEFGVKCSPQSFAYIEVVEQ